MTPMECSLPLTLFKQVVTFSQQKYLCIIRQKKKKIINVAYSLLLVCFVVKMTCGEKTHWYA